MTGTLMTPQGEVRHQEAMELLASLETASVPMIFADPPYGIGYHSNHHKGRNPHTPVANDWNFQIGPFLTECGRVLREGGVAYVCCRWDVMPLWAASIMPPLKMKTAIAWVKDNHSAGDLTGTFGNKYEVILFLVKGRHLLRGRRWSNVWEFPRVPSMKALHPTQKPVGLVQRAIEASSDLGELVVDPFCGSGTTAVAAMDAGRTFLVGDIDPTMVNLTRHRLGLPVESVSDPAPSAEFRPSFAWQIDHQFGAPADDLALLAEELSANALARQERDRA
jgi:site-specific DNA-methyltransferase (adenine-specific)